MANNILIRSLLHPAQAVKSLVAILEQIGTRQTQLEARIELLSKNIEKLHEAQMARSLDVMLKLEQLAPSGQDFVGRLETRHPVAVYSDDHKFPRGTANDNTRSLRFVRKVEEALGPNLKVMDLGCSGGGLVLNFIQRGHFAVGLEGSDYSLKNQRAEWALLRKNLMTCDITKPFALLDEHGQPMQFDLITAWEVLEHIKVADLAVLLANIAKHLAPQGRFMASVATFPDKDPATGAIWHVTLETREWWWEFFRKNGFLVDEELKFEARDFPRGGGQPGDWDALAQPHMGFHVIVKRA